MVLTAIIPEIVSMTAIVSMTIAVQVSLTSVTYLCVTRDTRKAKAPPLFQILGPLNTFKIKRLKLARYSLTKNTWDT